MNRSAGNVSMRHRNNNSAGCLYIVPTPIGNLEDITQRAIRVLGEVDFILAEDTRTSSKLLKHLGISKPSYSYHIYNEHKAVEGLVNQLKAGAIAALVSDAGTPGIADPGFLLVRESLKAGVKIDCLPGPTAFLPALVKSGFPTDRFVFEGFLPNKKGRQTRLIELSKESRTIILYESPHRLVKTLIQMGEILGRDREASVSRELTKIHEETVNGRLEELASHFTANKPKGELVIVVRGYSLKTNQPES